MYTKDKHNKSDEIIIALPLECDIIALPHSEVKIVTYSSSNEVIDVENQINRQEN